MCSTIMSVLFSDSVEGCIIIKYIMLENKKSNQDKLILPNSLVVVIWAVVFSLSIIFYLSMAFFEIGFQTKTNLLFNSPIQTGIAIILCLIDTAIYVNIAVVAKGKLIRNRKSNLINYSQSWLFITDCIVLFNLVARLGLNIDEGNDSFLVLSIFDLILFFKFLNIFKYDQMLKFYYFDDWSLLIYQFAKYLVLLAFLCHIVGCMFFMIDIFLLKEEWYPFQDHWLVSSQAMPQLYLAPTSVQYIYSFYFSIVTLSTTAYGDITPLNPTEVIFVLVVFTFLLLFYIYIFTQIYEGVTWFNRKKIRLRGQRYKISIFLENFKISANLRGRIISQFQFRQKNGQKLSKDNFICEISTKLAKNFFSTPYKYDLNKFIPRFITSSGIESQSFNGALSEKFYTPEESFFPIKEGESQRWMYFILKKNNVFRTLTRGTSSLTELAEKDRWLGINAFMTSQFDLNERWHVEIPTELTVLSFSTLRELIKLNQRSYQIYLEHCNEVLCVEKVAEETNKCLVCWKSCHSSRYCSEYRPDLENRYQLSNRKSQREQFCKKSKQSERKRIRIKRLSLYSRKVLNIVGKQSWKDQSSETNINIKSIHVHSKNKTRSIFEKVWKWNYYKQQHNILFWSQKPDHRQLDQY